MKQVSRGLSKPVAFFAALAILVAGAATTTIQAEEWHATVGAESPDRGSQAQAFLPNELWIHINDSIKWTFPTHERHTISFLKSGQIRPPNFQTGSPFGVLVGCPGVTPDGPGLPIPSFDNSACVTSDVLLVPEDEEPGPMTTPTYSVTFPAAGNFKFVCLVHADMTGVVHVLNQSEALPHDPEFYDQQAQREQARLLADASRLQGQAAAVTQGAQSNQVAAGIGQITTTGVGSRTASLMRFRRETIVVQVGDTVEWTNLDPSISHTITFGTEPTDPRPPVNVLLSNGTVLLKDGNTRQAVINSTADRVNSGFLSATPQDRANLAQATPNVIRFRVTFTSPGIFNYICAIHDQLGMKGTVIVHP